MIKHNYMSQMSILDEFIDLVFLLLVSSSVVLITPNNNTF